MTGNVLNRSDAPTYLNEDERNVLDSVQAFARKELAPRAAESDSSGRFPWKNVEGIHSLGLNGMFIPEEFGGSPVSYACYLACVREISRACAATGIIWATNFHALKPVIDFGGSQLQRRILPRMAVGGLAALAITEPNAGSDATGMETSFREAGDEVVIDGGKCFITNGDVADVYVIFGKWSSIADPRGAISVVVMERDTPGLRCLRNEDKMGLRASSTTALAFDGCRVPRENVLGAPGDGLRILFASLNRSRPSIAAHALGIARAALETALDYINTRRQSGRRILEFQGIQFMVADLTAELVLCESFLWSLARSIDAGASDFSTEASILKMRASDLAMRITTDAVQLLGGYGYCKDYPLERLMRDAKVTQIWEGTNQVHRQLIGRSLLTR
jgi:alkylation response protein AidB-like acyl-CoA dehydrogenase